MDDDWRAERHRALAEKARIEREKNAALLDSVKNYFQKNHGLYVSNVLIYP